jgi:methanogenic corrinoid protein MtbC1
MRVVTAQTGLSPHVLRAWERRYEAVAPGRSAAGQRLYSDADVDRLALLLRATQAGRAIGQVVRMPADELARLSDQDARQPPPLTPAAEHLDAALAEVRALAPERLHSVLRRALLSLGTTVFLEQVLAPLLSGIGDAWQGGSIDIAHEHAASEVAVRVLDGLLDDLEVADGGPVTVVATPSGERHSLGARLAAVTAAHDGWRVILLGADVPADEIAATARRHGARVVGLSVVAPSDLRTVRAGLRSLRAALEPRTALLVGGARAAELEPLGEKVTQVRDLAHWRSLLRGYAPARRGRAARGSRT